VTNVLTAEQAMTVQAAAEKLTSQQKETFQRRQKRVHVERSGGLGRVDLSIKYGVVDDDDSPCYVSTKY
jgi:hypothetical protein